MGLKINGVPALMTQAMLERLTANVTPEQRDFAELNFGTRRFFEEFITAKMHETDGTVPTTASWERIMHTVLEQMHEKRGTLTEEEITRLTANVTPEQRRFCERCRGGADFVERLLRESTKGPAFEAVPLPVEELWEMIREYEPAPGPVSHAPQ